MSNKEDLYIHVYTAIYSQTMAYRNPDEKWETGSTLLEFLYADLSRIDYGNPPGDNMEFLRSLHPYFRHISQSNFSCFLENSLNGAYKGLFCKSGLESLQKTYQKWLTDYAQHRLSETLFEDAGKYPFYTQTPYVMLDGQPALDYFLLGFEECLFLEFSEIIRHKVLVKICKNCRRLFIPKKSNIDYCPRVYTQDGKTCQDVGYTQTFARSVKNDDLLQAYTRAYKAHYARMAKPRKRAENLSREAFEAWYQEAKQKLNLARSGQLDPQEYKEWLKK